MLKSVIETTDNISNQDDVCEIIIKHTFKCENYVALNALLKERLFEIREFSDEDAKKVPLDPFEYM